MRDFSTIAKLAVEPKGGGHAFWQWCVRRGNWAYLGGKSLKGALHRVNLDDFSTQEHLLVPDDLQTDAVWYNSPLAKAKATKDGLDVSTFDWSSSSCGQLGWTDSWGSACQMNFDVGWLSSDESYVYLPLLYHEQRSRCQSAPKPYNPSKAHRNSSKLRIP